MTTAEKPCTRCGVEKPYTDYHRNAKNKDGYYTYCKVCVLAQRAEYCERIAAERVEPAPTDTKTCTGCGETKPITDYHRDSDKKDGYNPRCKACALARTKAYREANREAILAHRKNYHAEKWATDAEYREQCYAAHRRRRRMLASAKQEPYTRELIFARDGWVCGICSESIDPRMRYQDDPSTCATIDHIVPLSRGGDDTPANVQAAHGSCNYRKCNRVEHEDEDLEVAA
ncbi:HNH endonuclease [Dietzia sp. B19]|uniref:HNH endonuclease n=1 Tax=Dietzia sp. B19 TaxID=1630632 RepID=UPI0015FB319A|nr:HNH endonuclease [Dietzia sp. B19]MBB1057848.1 HNH endonuclease [Dietzia sp. B19]